MIKLPVFILMWALYLAIKIPTWALGFVAVPFLYELRFTRYERLPQWTRPWANPEDWEGHGNGAGSLPLWWVNKHGVNFKSFYKYHAVRNPANGLRSFEWLDLDIVPELVKYKTNVVLIRYEPRTLRKTPLLPKTVWYFAWQGFRAGFKIVHLWNATHYLEIKFGWRVEPSDAYTDTINIGIEDASFASKFLFYRKG